MTQELLTMEQLGGVAGGTKLETTEDCEFLNSLNGSIRRYSITDIGIHDYDDKVRSAWAKLGVSVIVDSGNFFSNGDALRKRQASFARDGSSTRNASFRQADDQRRLELVS